MAGMVLVMSWYSVGMIWNWYAGSIFSGIRMEKLWYW